MKLFKKDKTSPSQIIKERGFYRVEGCKSRHKERKHAERQLEGMLNAN